jgi:hypothetical protein
LISSGGSLLIDMSGVLSQFPTAGEALIFPSKFSAHSMVWNESSIKLRESIPPLFEAIG